MLKNIKFFILSTKFKPLNFKNIILNMSIIYFGISINDDLLKLDMYSGEDSNELEICENNKILLFLPDEKSIISFFNIINILNKNEIDDKIIILYDYKFWMSFKDWYEFNDKKWPSVHVNYIVDNCDELSSYLKNIKINKNIFLDDNIDNYNSILDKRPNIFLNESGVDDLINEIFEEIPLDNNNIFDLIIEDDYESD